MKELIDKLSLGIIEYESPIMQVSISKIEIAVNANASFNDSFDIFCTNDKELKGLIYSTDRRLIISNNIFIGKKNTIHYSIDTKYVREGEIIEGNISIVCNAGEFCIPFCVNVESSSVDTTVGNVKNLFHFTNLVQMSYDEAFKLFCSDKFVKTFLENDISLLPVYEGLIKSNNKNLAMEEFLVAANKKSIVNISLSSDGKEYGKLYENYGDTIIITKENWGYVHIDIEVSGEFIHIEKMTLTSSEFAGSNYELGYYIDAGKLAIETNYGRIRFKTVHQTIDYNIKIDNISIDNHEIIEQKKLMVKLYKYYLDFRMKKITVSKWAEDSNRVIERVRGIDDKGLFLKLVQAQILITMGRDSDGSWLLENVAEELIEKRNTEIFLYSFYLYVRTIQKRDDEFTAETIKKVKEYYDNGYDNWKLLWILMYMDENYDNNISLKLLRIKEQYEKGMRSPLMYFEALTCLNTVPQLLRVMDEFEIQVLNFGAKCNYITKQLAMQICEISMSVRKFNKILFTILTNIYKEFPTKEIITSICSMLIKANKTDNEYFRWYEEGIKKELKITSLYEYYIYSMDEEYKGDIPQIVLMYFAYNNSLISEKIDLLYENIILNKENMESLYNTCHIQIEKYAALCMLKGIMNRHLATIYKEIMTKSMISPELAEQLPGIINTYEIKCQNKNIRRVIIIHKETKKQEEYSVVKGKAYVRIYTEDAAVLFEDIYGNRFLKSVNHSMEKLLDMEDYLKLCCEISLADNGLILHVADRYLKYKKEPEKAVSMLKYISTMEDVREEYIQVINNEIIDYHSKNYDNDNLDDYIINLDCDKLDSEIRKKLIELTIVRGLYNRAYELIEIYSVSGIEPRRVLKCISKLIEDKGLVSDELMLNMAMYAFRRGKYNETILGYLSLFFNGSTKEMLEIWKACLDFDYESREIEERLIAQILFSGEYALNLGNIYEAYCKKGALSKVKRAYLFAKSYDYFVKEKVIDESVFRNIEIEYENDYEFHDVCKMAYLKYKSTDANLNEEQIQMCRDFMLELCKRNKNLNMYKEYKKFFRLPEMVIDKTIVEYRTNPKNRVFIHYMLEKESTDKDSYAVAEMTDIFNGVYVYSFILFYGEHLQYYITEEVENEEIITESNTLTLSDTSISSENTYYGLLNDMMICREMHEEKTLEDIADDYLIQKNLMERIFRV